MPHHYIRVFDKEDDCIVCPVHLLCVAGRPLTPAYRENLRLCTRCGCVHILHEDKGTLQPAKRWVHLICRVKRQQHSRLPELIDSLRAIRQGVFTIEQYHRVGCYQGLFCGGYYYMGERWPEVNGPYDCADYFRRKLPGAPYVSEPLRGRERIAMKQSIARSIRENPVFPAER
jgi:hypothetical protein